MKSFLISIGLALAFFLVLWSLQPGPDGSATDEVRGLPWQIDILPDGNSRVFGLTLGSSTLADAQVDIGGENEVAAVAAPGEKPTVEAYFRSVTAGAVTGKMVLTADLPTSEVTAMWHRAVKVEYMESSTKKAVLTKADTDLARRALIRSIAFVPSVNLDEAIIVQRFGPPAERIRSDAETEHFLYPERGLDIVLSGKNKEVLQYVAPRHFEALRRPLLEARDKPTSQ